jgi:hypothetical protein
VVALYDRWLDLNDLSTDWKSAAAWDIDSLLEHTTVASQDHNGAYMLGVLVQINSPLGHPNSPPVSATVKWLKRNPRLEAYIAMPSTMKTWLDAFGGRGAPAVPVRRSNRIPAGTTMQPPGRSSDPWHQWLWSSELGAHTVVPIGDLYPVLTCTIRPTIGGHTDTFTVIAETTGWTPRTATWARISKSWSLNAANLSGTCYKGTKLKPTAIATRASSWAHTMANHTAQSVLLGFSDCSKATAGPKKALSYGWITGGLVDPAHVIELGGGRWSLRQGAEDDFRGMQRGLWGGAVIQGCQRELTTYRGEGMGVLGIMRGVRDEGYIGRLALREDNKAVAEKYNKRGPQVREELSTDDSSVPCLDDLADSDLWTAMDTEKAEWGDRAQLE